ncbi:HD domain-containing protein [Aquicella lusitana]|uniref:Putative HD phosphohydrolase n=1 Tax=Aquicella lusitana TaxID=254246 RepID=A0A370FZE4_9COXI|nr:HD domain-containing protein [Aquicella lusitana]RDI36320.1 putative HD phosphohydrolase [Aquicella lusitana]VVC74612.1 hypothetical protein AQULUS_23780 [Aquicella lusitana]
MQLEHALQCAYFAEQSGHSNDVILACLFHDIGHFASEYQHLQMADLGTVNHEWIGAKLVYDWGFSKKVALLIGNHVDAKRYLAAKKEKYFAQLSAASKKTLDYQGGPMSNQEMVLFEKHSFFKEILQVRINDEKGKETDLTVPNLTHYLPKIRDHLSLNNGDKDIHIPVLRCNIDETWVNQFKAALEKQEM